MNTGHDLDLELATWFDERAQTTPPAGLLSRTLARVETVRQRPGLLTRGSSAGRAVPFGRFPLLVPVGVVLMLLVAIEMAMVGSQFVTPPVTKVWTTTGVWQQSVRVAFRAQLDPGHQAASFKWRAGTYSRYTGSGWDWGDVERRPLSANQPLDIFSAEGDQPTTAGRSRVEITIAPDAFRDPTILGPNMLEVVDLPTTAFLAGADGWFTTLETTDQVGTYKVSALIPVPPGAPGGLTEARLRAARTDYSTGLLATYTALPSGAMGPNATALLEAVRAEVPAGLDAGNPYDLARTMETYLRDAAHFTYAEDVRTARDQDCAGLSTVECFATIRQGYCEYYASTMVVLLRASGVPARIVYGFLPGLRDAAGTELIGTSNAHWWVEVYFPGIGWSEFDPTGGARGQPLSLPPGSS
jgi:transglutaminase-like putative cysteine protease